MLSFDEIDRALETGSLSEALSNLELYARRNRLNSIAEWCDSEVGGYKANEVEELKLRSPYRFAPVQWKDIRGNTLILPPELSDFRRVPLIMELATIEAFSEEGMALKWEESIEILDEFFLMPVSSAYLSSAELKGVLNHIRREARIKLHSSISESGPKQFMNTKITVLFFAANPYASSHLALDEEIRAIMAKIRASHYRDVIEVQQMWAVTPDDLLQGLNQYKPHIVHFSGHGSDSAEIILAGNDGSPRPVNREALVQLFRTLRGEIKVVLLNACFSHSQAEGITAHIPCAIGMREAIGDDAAIIFAGSFYRAIGFGKSVADAFEQGKTALMLEGISGEDIPQLLTGTGVDADQIVLFSS